MTARRLQIGVDLDEVCYPFIDVVRRHVAALTGGRLEDLVWPSRWGVPLEGWGFTQASFEAFFVTCVREGRLFRDGDPLDGAVEGLRELTAAGHEVHLVTARRWEVVQTEIEDATRSWLAQHDLRHHSLTFAEDKTVVPTDVFLDDAVHNYEAIEQAGGHPVLYHQPYNAGHQGRRVRSWPEFVDLVAALAG